MSGSGPRSRSLRTKNAKAQVAKVQAERSEQPEPHSELLEELARAYFDLIMRRMISFQGFAAELDLSPIQARTLFRMDPKGALAMSEMAQLAGCGPSNLTGIIDKLEARGLVERRLAEGDRRIKMLKLTRKGVMLRAQLEARLSAPVPWMMALSKAEQQQLCALLKKGLAYEQIQAVPTGRDSG